MRVGCTKDTLHLSTHCELAAIGAGCNVLPKRPEAQRHCPADDMTIRNGAGHRVVKGVRNLDPDFPLIVTWS